MTNTQCETYTCYGTATRYDMCERHALAFEDRVRRNVNPETAEAANTHLATYPEGRTFLATL